MSRGNHGLGEATVSIACVGFSAFNNHHHFRLPQSWDELSDLWTVVTFLGRENVYLGRQGTPSSGPGFHLKDPSYIWFVIGYWARLHEGL